MRLGDTFSKGNGVTKLPTCGVMLDGLVQAGCRNKDLPITAVPSLFECFRGDEVRVLS